MPSTTRENKPTVIMSGLPGKMATAVFETLLKRDDFDVYPQALTAEATGTYTIGGKEIILNHTNYHADLFNKPHVKKEKNLIVVDFTQPDAVNRNAELYCKHGIPFVMGTTGGDRAALERVVIESGNRAVIAPNMAKPIVLLQSMFEYAAQNFPHALGDFGMSITESHQSAKKDTSGTAKSMVSYFQELGVDFSVDNIRKIRDPVQQLVEGVPAQDIEGHGWHEYGLASRSGVKLGFTHNVNGRQVYADGTLDAIKFLDRENREAPRSPGHGKVYTMIDVLKAGNQGEK